MIWCDEIWILKKSTTEIHVEVANVVIHNANTRVALWFTIWTSDLEACFYPRIPEGDK